MKKLKLIVSLFVMFLGLCIFSPKNLTISAAEPQDPIYWIDDLSSLPDGTYKIKAIDDGYAYEIYYYFQNPTATYNIEYQYIDWSKLYKYPEHTDFEAIEIKNGVQTDINFHRTFQQLEDGLYYFEDYMFLPTVSVTNLYSKVTYQIINVDTTGNILSSIYKLDYVFNGQTMKSFHLLLVSYGEIVDCSDGLMLFNTINPSYHLFQIDEHINDKELLVHDQDKSYNILLRVDNLLDFKVNDYLVHSYHDDIYFTIDKLKIDDMILDSIHLQYDIILFAPSILDILNAAKNGLIEAVNKVIGYDPNILNGLYAVGFDDKLYGIGYYDKKEIKTNAIFAQAYMFYPSLKESYSDDLIINYMLNSLSTGFLVDKSNFIRNYGNSLLPDNPNVVFFKNGVQLDISYLDLTDILTLQDHWMYNLWTNDYELELYFKDNFDITSPIEIDDIKSIPDGFGYMKFEKTTYNHKAIFFIDGAFYLAKNYKLINQLKYDIQEYNVTFHKTNGYFLITFFHKDEVFFHDLVSGEYYTLDTIYVTGSKEFSFDNVGRMKYTYINFNLSVDIDKIVEISFNFDTRVKQKIAGIPYYESDWENKSVKITDNSIREYRVSAIQWIQGVRKSLLDDRIGTSDIKGYQHKVLISMDYPSGVIASSVGVLSSSHREFKDLELMKIDYWKNGKFYSMNVDDDFPSDGKTPGYDDNLFDDIYHFLKKLLEKAIWLLYIIVGILILIVVAFVFRLLGFIFSKLGFKKKKRYYRRR